MHYYNQEKFLNNETTRTLEFLDKIYVEIDKACQNMVEKLSKDIEEESKTELVSSQIIATSFFQFKAAGVPDDAVKMIFHTYMSAQYTPFEVVKEYLYMHEEKDINAEKIYTIQEMMMNYYSVFCTEYDKEKDPQVINTIMHNFSTDVKKVKTFSDEMIEV